MRIGEILLKQGLLTAVQRDAALAAQRQFGGRLGTSLIELGYVDVDVVARALSGQLGVDAVLAEDFATIDKRAVALVPARLAEGLKAMLPSTWLRCLFSVAWLHPYPLRACTPSGTQVF